jgi:hypothetical protein
MSISLNLRRYVFDWPLLVFSNRKLTMAFRPLWRIIVALVVIWCLIILYMSVEVFKSSDMAEHQELKLNKLLSEVEILRKQNEELSKLANEIKYVYFDT